MFDQLSLSVKLFVTTCAIKLLSSFGFCLVFGTVQQQFVLFMNFDVVNQLGISAKFPATNCALILFDFVVNNFHMHTKQNCIPWL